MTSYGVRIFDRSSGRFIFTAPGVRSPYRVGQVVAGAFSALVGRDGFLEGDLELRSFVDEGSRLRPMDVIEEGEMNTAFQEFVSSARGEARSVHRGGHLSSLEGPVSPPAGGAAPPPTQDRIR